MIKRARRHSLAQGEGCTDGEAQLAEQVIKRLLPSARLPVVIQVSPSVSLEGGRMIVPRFITMSIVGANLMVLILAVTLRIAAKKSPAGGARCLLK